MLGNLLSDKDTPTFCNHKGINDILSIFFMAVHLVIEQSPLNNLSSAWLQA